MANSDALVTVAMLASVYQNEQKDYLDIITPFVCNLLPARGQTIDFSNLQERMESEFGFQKIPIGVLKKIVDRLCNKQTPICSYVTYGEYVVANSIDNTEFRNRRKEIKKTFEEVAIALQKYLSDERGMNLETEKCASELLSFLDHCGHQILRESATGSLPLDEKISRYIAKFIQTEQKRNSITYDNILELARGYMIYRCVYFLSQNAHDDSAISLTDVIIYLDTPLIIDLLNLDTDEGNRAVMDVVFLAQSMGAQVRVLEHCVEELQGILNAYLASYPNIQKFKLRNLTTSGRSQLGITAIANGISKQIESILGQGADTAPKLGVSSDWDRLNSEEALRRYYEDRIRELSPKVKGGNEVSDTWESIIGNKRIINDVQTLAFALQLREGERPRSFEKSKVIVLSNSKMARNAICYFYDDFDKKAEINLVYNIIDFSCLTWLGAPVQTSDMAEDILLYNAAAALDASDQIIDLMLKYVDELTAVGNIGDDIAYLLRTHPIVREAVADITGNDVEKFEINMIMPIYERVVEQKAIDVVAEQYRPQINELKNSLAKQQDRERQRVNNLSERAVTSSERATNCVKKTVTAIWRIIEFFAVICLLYIVFKNVKQPSSWSISDIIFTIFSLWCCIDFCTPKLHFMDKQINRLANWCGDKAYDLEIKRGNTYLNL